MIIHGEGNQPDEGGTPPLWKTYNCFLSYQFLHGTLTTQYVWGQGNQRGNWVEPDDSSEAIPYSGYSAFFEWKFGQRHQWRIICNYDWFERLSDAGNDFSFNYYTAGVGYDLGRENILMLDFDQRDWRDPHRPDDRRVQVVLQLKF